MGIKAHPAVVSGGLLTKWMQNSSKPAITIIEVGPRQGGGWQAREAKGVAPYFLGRNAREYALGYARQRAAFRTGVIRVLNENGDVTESIAFAEAQRSL